MMEKNTALAIDCARDYCSVALLHEDTVTLKEEREPRAAAGALLSMVEKLLKEGGCSPGDLDFMAVTHGPGSFTGLRIACTIVQAIAFVHRVPVVPLSTLQVMAHAYFMTHQHRHVIALLDAYGEEVYWASYELNDLDTIVAQEAPQLAKPETITVPFEAHWHVIGDACLLPETLVLCHSGYYNASHLFSLGKSCFSRSETLRAEALAPLYLRDESAWCRDAVEQTKTTKQKTK